MNIFILPPLICSIFALGLGVFVLLKNMRSPINQILSLLCFETFHWQLCWFISYFLTGTSAKDLIIRIAFSVIIFIPFTYYHFAVLFLKLSPKTNYVKLSYLLGTFFLLFLWSSSLFIEGFRDFWWGYYPKAGFLFSVYLIVVFFFITRALVLILQAARKKHQITIDQNKIKFMALAHFIYYFATVEYLIDYGVPIYPMGVFFLISSFTVISYAILRYRLLDINIVIKKGLVYSTIIAIFTGLYLSTVYIISQFFRNLLGIESLGIVAAMLFIFALFFQPLKNRITQIIDKLFFKSSYEYQVALRKISKKIATAANLQELNKLTSQEIKEILKTKEVRIQTFI